MAVLDSPKCLQSPSTTSELAMWPFYINNKSYLSMRLWRGPIWYTIGPSYTTSNYEAYIGKRKGIGSQFGHNREAKLRFSLPFL